MNKRNFFFWCKVARYAADNEEIHSTRLPVYKGVIDKGQKKLHNMYHDGYLNRKQRAYSSENSFTFTPTEKFKTEFREKYVKLCSKIFQQHE